MALKSGSVADFAGSLAEAIEIEMKSEWLAVKGVPLPEQGVEDRRLLFVAIARGLFVFLKANEDALMRTVQLHEKFGVGSTLDYDVTQLELNL